MLSKILNETRISEVHLNVLLFLLNAHIISQMNERTRKRGEIKFYYK